MARKSKKNASSIKVIVILITVIILLFLALILASSSLYIFGFKPHKVSGNSMSPEYPKGAYILSEDMKYLNIVPQRGDVVIIESPYDPNRDLIQRIIALPKDKIMIKGGKVNINGQIIKEPYLADRTYTQGGKFLEENVEFEVPENFYISMADNRGNARDSREIGPISMDFIKSKVVFCYANCK